MTYITQLTWRKTMRISRIMTMVLTGLVLVMLQSSTVQAQWATNGNNINNTNTGNVGIGTTTPNAPLEVKKSQNGGTVVRTDNPDASSGGAYSGLTMFQNGVARAQIASTNDGCTGCTGGAKALQIWNWLPGNLIFATNGTERMRIDSSGKLGIGTTNPGRPLVVTADASGVPLRVYRNASNVGWGTGIDWAFNNSAGNVTDYAYVNSTVVTNTAGSENGTLGFFTIKSGTLTQQAIIDQNGNVGIGTTGPTAKLDVAGGINASGTITGGNIVAKYQDFAEWFSLRNGSPPAQSSSSITPDPIR